jgi:hypothetical protein
VSYAQQLQRASSPLRILHVKHREPGPTDPMPAIEAILRAANNINEVFISSPLNTLPAVDCITRHGKTLRMLLVSIGTLRFYSPTQTAAILQACLALEQLGIRLPRLYLGSGDSWKRHWTLKRNFGNIRRIRKIIVSQDHICYTASWTYTEIYKTPSPHIQTSHLSPPRLYLQSRDS